MKKYFLVACIVQGLSIGLYAQSVGINADGSTPDASAILDIKSTGKGLLIPRLTSAQRTSITTPATGLMVFDTNTNSFWYYDGAWKNLSGGWGIAGNSGTNPATHFIGTTDNKPLVIKVNNQLSGSISVFSTSWGYSTLINNTGIDNTAFGNIALKNNTTGSQNVAVGDGALLSNTTATDNTALGHQALLSNTTGGKNTATGSRALIANTTGSDNTAIGTGVLFNNTTGSGNTATGGLVLLNNTTGKDNTASGYEALISNTTGYQNISFGSFSLFSNFNGHDNTSSGYVSMVNNTSGQFNTAMGSQAMIANVTGHNNTTIGAFSNVSLPDLTNATAIGYEAIVDASNKVRIGNAAVTVIEGQVPFTTPSDGRFKYNVQEDVKGLDFILQLRPVTYQFDVKQFDAQLNTKTGSSHTRQDDNMIQASYTVASAIRRTGFIAQEVEQASVKSGYNFSGIIKPQTPEGHYGLSYESFVVPLVKAVQEQEKIIEALKKEDQKQEEMISALLKRIERLEKNNNPQK
jgi:trimeric autotransporter adhesin